MFANAYATAATFTKPLVISQLRHDGTCVGGAATFVIVNDEGWFLTAAHIFQEWERLDQSRVRYRKRIADEAAIQADASLLSDQKRKRVRALGAIADEDIKDFSFWWGRDAVKPEDIRVLPGADLAVGRLRPFDAAWVTGYPTFKDPARDLRPGTSLCRLGFPFHEIKPTYDNGRFVLPPGTFPMVFFPNEGLLTRFIEVNAGPPRAAFLETSSPGLRGQSGGPIFDQQGTIWAIQSHTGHLPLGFNPPVPGGRPGQTEHQFLNVGRGAHPQSNVDLLTEAGARHTLSAY
jgi:hypothetical protein